eukprot:TRINITY_DN18248_c0_g1_i1.p1 TRINITY_DN18248_c0_g1~~TRINITY_DN18248_c0_g1_i1.p1  ORF type:complete len:515 (-),score=64.31 TRINITY_DN18248_c0_g1_i1:127-1671(-)
MPTARWVAIVLATAPIFSSAGRMSGGIGFIHRAGTFDMHVHGRPGTRNCTTHWYKQTIDHFSWAPTPTSEQTFQQRYLVHDAFWKKGGPIFFYCGNEANVELYVNATGLMWENARNFGAALVFAEHRYYGETQPFGKDSGKHMHYLTMEQALADYAQLIHFLKEDWKSEESAVVGFGGSYGGMLSAWLRMKYPGALDGAIAASAPILAFHGETLGFGDGKAFWQVVTRDASPEAGSAAACAPNVRSAWQRIFDVGRTSDGRRLLANIFKLCGSDPLKSESDVMRLASMQVNAWDTMAMGNFPYPSNYLIFSQTQDATTLLPAFPVRAACEHMNHDLTTDLELFAALRDAGGVFYNASKKQKCFELPDDPNYDGIWDYQWCTEMLPQETYFARDGIHDMFWPRAENMTAISHHCKSAWGVEPRADWISTEFGGTAGASNIVFSNGLYDPWSSGGVLKDVSDSAVAVIIPEGAHHLDLMFSHPLDPESVKTARRVELAHIQKWIDQKGRDSAPLVL